MQRFVTLPGETVKQHDDANACALQSETKTTLRLSPTTMKNYTSNKDNTMKTNLSVMKMRAMPNQPCFIARRKRLTIYVRGKPELIYCRMNNTMNLFESLY